MALFLRGLIKFVALVAVAGGLGLALGLGLLKLADDGDSAAAGTGTSTTATRTRTTTTASDPLDQVEVKIVTAVLHPAATPAGKRRDRARVGVRIQVKNSSNVRITPERPALLAAGVTVRTDPHVTTPGARLEPLAPGTSADVTVRFEVEGRVTRQLISQRRARIRVIGQTLPVVVKIGAAVTVPAGRAGTPAGGTAP